MGHLPHAVPVPFRKQEEAAMPPAVYRPRIQPPITSYLSEYVDRVDLVEMLDKEYRYEENGVIIFEYFIHVGLRI
jgi:hypothetical protein